MKNEKRENKNKIAKKIKQKIENRKQKIENDR